MRILIVVLAIIVVGIGGYFLYQQLKKPTPKQVIVDPYSTYGKLMRESEESVARGIHFLNQGDVGQAKFEFEDAIRLDTNNYRAYYNLGIIYRAMGEFDRAEGYYRTAIEFAPQFYVIYNNLANLLLLKHAAPDSALVYISKAVSAYPDCTDFVDTKIDVLLASGKKADAEKLWRQAIAKDSTNRGLINKFDIFEAQRGQQ